MAKKYVVRLTMEERQTLREVSRKLAGGSEKAKRANILLQADVNGPGWTDQQIAEAYRCRTQTVANVRQRLVEEGFERALERKKRQTPPTPKKLDGKQEAKVIALRLGSPPDGYGQWSLRLLAEKTVEAGIAESISHESVRQILKKRG
jgi:transposase